MSEEYAEYLAAKDTSHEGIGLFDRTNLDPVDEIDERERAQLVESVFKVLNNEARAILVEHMRQQREECEKQAKERATLMLVKLFGWACFPVTHSKLWGVVYALDLPYHGGKSLADKARELGLERASISHAARQVVTMFGLKPSRWMRSEDTVQANKQARERGLQ